MPLAACALHFFSDHRLFPPPPTKLWIHQIAFFMRGNVQNIIYLLFVFLAMTGVSMPARGQDPPCGVGESFTELPTNNSTSYQLRTWNGDDGFEWVANGVRTDQTLDGKAITWGTSGIRNLISPSRDGGMGTLSFSYARAFTGTDSRSLEVYVNGNLIETIQVSNSSDAIQQFTREIHSPGTVQIEIRSTGAGQVKLDNLHWNCFSAADCETPDLQASNLVVNNLLPASVGLSWEKGDGSHSLVLVREGVAVSSDPEPNTSYLAESVFGDGDTLADGSFVVYSATGNQVNLTGLAWGTTYHAKVIAYNCINGNEKYLTLGAPAQTSFTTPPATISNFRIACTSANTATITWDPPSGNYDGVVIGVRQGSNPPHSLFSINPSAINYQESHAQFGTGHQYGSTSPNSFVVYKGSNNEAVVNFPAPDPPYIVKAYVYHGTNWSPATPTRSISSLGVPEVSTLAATGLNTQVQLVWTNPVADCFDEVIIVAHTQPVTGVPEGIYLSNSRNYSDVANPDFPGGGKVVYNGLYGLQTITGLENDIQYSFKAFVRKGTEWSSGVEETAIPANITILDYADLAVLGINTDIGSGDDEMNVVLFVDFVAGSMLDFTDNGYERLFDGYWGTTEGVVRLTRINSTLDAGTVITIRGRGSNFTVIVDDEPDPDWEITNLNSGIEGGSFNLSGADQVWFMQGGSWSRSEGLHRGIYTGKVLYGWTASGWESDAGYDSASGSTLYPGADCSHTDVSALGNNSKVKYTGPIDAATRGDWIRRINNSAHWTGYSTNVDYHAGGSFESSIPVISSGMDAGKWLGATDDNWFDCANWSNLHIPGAQTHVVLDNDAEGNVVISGGEAFMQSLTFLDFNKSFTIIGAETTVRILGDVVVSAGAIFNQHSGTLHLGGDLENNGAMILNGGTLIFDGNTPQQITQPVGHLNVGSLVVNNPHGVTMVNNDLVVNGELIIQEGFLQTNQTIHLKNTSPDALIAEEGTFVLGSLRRDVTSPGIYLFPVGFGVHRQNAIVQLNEPTGIGNLSVSFHQLAPNQLDISALGLKVDGTPLDELLDGGYWSINPDVAALVDYHITLQIAGSGNPGSDPRQHTIVKREDQGSNWLLDGLHTNATQVQSGNVFTAVRTHLSGFSDFAIAKSDFGPLPIELLHFTAHPAAEGVWLTWSTAAEINNDYFTLQRSPDLEQVVAIGTVAGAGLSSTLQHYNFFDPVLSIEQPLYYRLKQTDLDGTATFSKWVTVSEGSSRESGLRWVRFSQYENRASLLLEVIAGRAITIGAYDDLGREHYRFETQTHHPVLEHTLPLPTPGLWIIRVSDGHHTISGKLMMSR
jgi:hypothetical protein